MPNKPEWPQHRSNNFVGKRSSRKAVLRASDTATQSPTASCFGQRRLWLTMALIGVGLLEVGGKAWAGPYFPPEGWVAGYAARSGCLFGHPYMGRGADHPRMLADVNGDGLEDVVGFGDDGVWVSLSNGEDAPDSILGGGFRLPELWLENFGYSDIAGGWRGGIHPRFLADVNADGRADIVGFGNAAVHVGLSTGSSFSGPGVWVEGYGFEQGWEEDRHPRTLADVDGDGRKDVVGFADDGVYVSLSTGSGFTEPMLWIANYGYGFDAGSWRTDSDPRIMADVDGDGRKDVVGFANDGVYVSLSNGYAFREPELWVSGFESALGWHDRLYPRHMADVNGDGLEDVVGFGHAGVYVSVSDGESFAWPELWLADYGLGAGGWTTGSHPRLLADLDRDRKADIVGFGHSETYISFSDGTRFSKPVVAWLNQDSSLNLFTASAGWTVAKHPRWIASVARDAGYPIQRQSIVGFGNCRVYVASPGIPWIRVVDTFTPPSTSTQHPGNVLGPMVLGASSNTVPAAPRSVRIAATTTTSVSLAWDSDSSPKTHYRVYQDSKEIETLAASATSITVKNLRTGYEYCSQVAARNQGRESPRSNQVCTVTKSDGLVGKLRITLKKASDFRCGRAEISVAGRDHSVDAEWNPYPGGRGQCYWITEFNDLPAGAHTVSIPSHYSCAKVQIQGGYSLAVVMGPYENRCLNTNVISGIYAPLMITAPGMPLSRQNVCCQSYDNCDPKEGCAGHNCFLASSGLSCTQSSSGYETRQWLVDSNYLGQFAVGEGEGSNCKVP